MPENRVMFPKPVVLVMWVTALKTVRREQVYLHIFQANDACRTLYHGFSKGSEPCFDASPLSRRGNQSEGFETGRMFEHHWQGTLNAADETLFSSVAALYGLCLHRGVGQIAQTFAEMNRLLGRKTYSSAIGSNRSTQRLASGKLRPPEIYHLP